MARKPRCYSGPINHVMMRGIGHMDLFFDARDYNRFLTTMQRYVEKYDVTIFAYCLMPNHVHLLMRSDSETMGNFCKSAELSYSSYFRKRYGHVGYLFQDRYRNETIDSDSYLLAAARYILHNPEAAAISKWQTYPWSSAGSYLSGSADRLSDISLATEVAGGHAELLKFLEQTDNVQLIEWDDKPPGLSDKDVLEMIRSLTGEDSPFVLNQMDRKDRNAILKELKSRGASIRQLERITGINRNVVQRA